MDSPISNPLTLWGIIGILSGVIALLFKMLISEKDKRFIDQSENNEKYQNAMGEFSTNIKLLLAKLDGQEK